MPNTKTQGRKADRLQPKKVAEALYHDVPVEHRGWLIRINSKTDTIEVFPPKGDTRHQAFETDLCHLDRAVRDFCKLADMPIPGVNKHPKDQVSVGSPSKVLGPDSSVGEGWKNPKVNERPTGLDQKGTSAPNKNLGVDTSSQNVPHFNPQITKRPKDPVGRGGLPDTSLGEDSSSAPTHWRDRIVKVQEDGRTGRHEALHPAQKPRRGPGQLGYGKAQMGEEAAPMVDGSGPTDGIMARRRRADSDPFDVTPVEEPGKKLNKGEDPSDPKEVITTEQGEGEELRTETEGQHDKEGRFTDSFQFPKVDASEAYRQMTAKRPSAELLKDILDPKKWAAGNLMDPAGTFDDSNELEPLPDEDMPGPVEGEGEDYFEPDAEELVLYITNDNDLYERNLMPIVKNLMRKVKNGTFDESLSVKLWGYLAEAGAQKYAKEMEGSVRPMPWHKLFPTSVRQQAAQQLAEHYNPAILHGEFGDVWPKAGQADAAVEGCSGGDVKAVAPEGWEDTIKKMKKEPGIDNPWALANDMKNKGYTPGGKDKEAAPPAGVEQGVFHGAEDVPEGSMPVRGRRQAGPRLRENWGAAGEYGRDLEAESGEELHALTLALGGQEVDWSRFRPTMPEGGEGEEGEQSTQPEGPKAQGGGVPSPAPAAPVTAQMRDEFEEEAAEGGLGFFNLRDAYDYYTGMFGEEAPEWSAQEFQKWCSKTLRHKRPEDYTQEDMNQAFEASHAGAQMPGVAASRLDPNAFMQPNIEEGDWVIVNGNYGGEVIPADLVDMAEIQKMQKSLERGPLDFVELPGTDLQQYTQNDELYEIEVKHGFGARLSAPGYMDATDWDFFETEEEAMAYLEETYGDDFEEEEEEEEVGDEEHLASRRRAGPADFVDPNEPKPQGNPTDEFLHAEGNPPVDEGQQMTPGSPIKQGRRQAGGFYDENEEYNEKDPQSVADNYINGNWEDVINAIQGNVKLAFDVLEMLPPEAHDEYVQFVQKVASKEAVDEKAKDYWGGYFGEYGKDLTEEKKLTKPPSGGKSKKKEDPKEARRQAALRARKLAQAAAPIAQPAPPAQSPTNPPASGAPPATPGAPAAPKPAPGAPGAAPMTTKTPPGPMPAGSGDAGLQALGWTAEEISLMDEEDKKKILQIKLSKPGSNAKPKTPGADQKAPAGPGGAGPGAGPVAPTIPPSPLAPTPGNVPAGATPAPGAPKPTAAVRERLAAMILKKVSRRRAIRAQVTPPGSADPNMTPPVGTSTAAQPGAPVAGPTAGPGKSAPGAAATPKGTPPGGEGSADQKAFDILQAVQQAPVSAASPEQVLSAKVSELARRLLTEIGMTTSDAKQLFGIPSDGGLDKLFQ